MAQVEDWVVATSEYTPENVNTEVVLDNDDENDDRSPQQVSIPTDEIAHECVKPTDIFKKRPGLLYGTFVAL